MAQATDVVRPVQTAQASDLDLSELAGSAALSTAGATAAPTTAIAARDDKQDKALPLPGWIKAIFYVFPVVLYVPDIIFNYIVYSDGVQVPDNLLVHGGQVVLWGFLSVGVVGMAYLLSVLAPFHWSQGHRIQAFFCGIGVVIATFITTWNSLAYRSLDFHDFKTDQWIYSIWPQLHSNGISFTMILVAVAPPFWGLFWAVVQPTETGRNLRQLRESHAEKLLRVQQEAEVKALRAQANAKIREAQLRGMAATAAAAREQAKGFIGSKRENIGGDAEQSGQSGQSAKVAGSATRQIESAPAESTSNVLQLPTLPVSGRDAGNGHSGHSGDFYNHAAGAPAAYVAPAASASAPLAQPSMMANADVQGVAGVPLSDAVTMGSRRPPMIGASFDLDDNDDLPTGSTGPRPSVRRTLQTGSLVQNIDKLAPSYAQAVEDAMRQLHIPLTRRGNFPRELTELVAEKLNIDDQNARIVIGRFVRERDPQRSSR